MKLRLRLLVATFCVLTAILGARISYLRQYAAYHEREAARYVKMIEVQQDITTIEVESALEVAAADPDDFRLDFKFVAAIHHQAAARDYRDAAYHPWTIVHEQPLPERVYSE